MNMQALGTRLFFAINQGTENRFFDILMPVLTERGYFLFLPYIVYLIYRGSSIKNIEWRSYLIPALWTLFIAVCAFPHTHNSKGEGHFTEEI